ncbi:unnamed protein product [Euphydryas editha]|uniref:Protein takeout-like n=1 Tax=Euphydryas editha TaxID=104508 RepID=A0AAU9TDX6_EUPED|nr:unnamed protein product [Euphydryas editha]
MINKYLSVLFVLYWQLLVTLATPECYAHHTFKKCSLQDSDCLTKRSNAAIKNFTRGIPELGIENMNQMLIDPTELKIDGTIQELNNIQVEGLENATINELRFIEPLKIIRLSFDTTFVFNYDYIVEGFLFMQPIVGEGPATVKIKNIQTDMIFFYDIIKKENGKHKLVIKDYRFGFNIKDSVEYNYMNLFHGDKKKNDLVNDFLNKNWTIITNVFGTYFYDMIYQKMFKAIRKYMRSQNLEDIVLFE